MTEMPHSFRDWEEGPAFKCAMTVTMPNGDTMSFFGEGKTAASARRIASFKASFKANELKLNEDAGDDEDSSGTEDDDFLEGAETLPTPANDDASPSEDLRYKNSAVGAVREFGPPWPQNGQQDKEPIEADPVDEESDVELVWTSTKRQSNPVRKDYRVALDESDDDIDDEVPLNVLQGKLDSRNHASPRMPFETDTRDSARKQPEWEQPKAFGDSKPVKAQQEATLRRKRKNVEKAVAKRNPRQRVAPAADVFLPRFEDPVVSPEPKSSGDIALSYNAKRKEYIVEPRTTALSRGDRAVEDPESPVIEGESDLVAFQEEEGEVFVVALPQTEGSVDKPTFRKVDSDPEAEVPARQVGSRVDLVTDLQFKDEVNTPASRDQDSDSDFGGLAFHEAKPKPQSPPHSDLELEHSQPIFREAVDPQVTPPASPRDEEDVLGDTLIFREKRTRSPSPLLFKSVGEEPTYPEAGVGAESPPEVEEVTISRARKVVEKLLDEPSEFTEDSDDNLADVLRAQRSRRKASKPKKKAESADGDGDGDMFGPDGYGVPAWMQYHSRQPLRNYGQRPTQSSAPKRRRLMDPQGRSMPVRRDRSNAFQKSGTRPVSDGGASRQSPQVAPTGAPHTIAKNPSPSTNVGGEGQEEGEWNVVPKVKGAAGNGSVVPIPRVKSGKASEINGKSRPNGEKSGAVTADPTTNGGDTGPRLRRDQRCNGTEKRNERNRSTASRGRHPRSFSSGVRHDLNLNGHPRNHMMPGPPVAHSLNGMLGDHGMNGIPTGPGMNPMSNMPWYPTQETMPQTHQMPQHGLVPPPNMYMPVMPQNPYFPAAQPHPNMYGYGPPEHPQAQWQRQAVSAAWLDHQIQSKQRSERRISRYKEARVEPLRDSSPVEAAAVATQDKSSPETPTTVIEPGEGSSGDDEDGEDHISTLHMMAARLRKWSNPVFTYENIGKRWECTGKVKLLPFKQGDEPLLKTVIARSRKRGKQKASKRLMIALKEVLAAPKEHHSSDNDGPTDAQTAAMERNTGISTAIGAMNQLWHWNKLDTQPDARFEVLEGGKWRCTFVLTIPNIGTVNVSEEGPQKKVAKSSASYKALERLRALKVIRPEEFVNVNAPKVVKDDEEDGVGKVVNESKVAKEDIVQVSDDEDGEVRVEEEDSFEGRVVLPKQYTLVIASNPQECDEWRKVHAKPGSEVGMYVDSWSARRAFDEPDCTPASAPHNTNDTQKQRILCFSNKASALVLRVDKCKDEESKKADYVDGFWLPEPVRLLLKDGSVRKHGHSIDDGLMGLRQVRDIRARALNDISILSSALSSSSHTDGTRVLCGMRELTKHWLKKEVVSLNLKDVWRNEAKAQEAVRQGVDESMGMAVLSAFASSCIQEQMKHAAARKQIQLHGTAAEFGELSKRLMHNPFAA